MKWLRLNRRSYSRILVGGFWRGHKGIFRDISEQGMNSENFDKWFIENY